MERYGWIKVVTLVCLLVLCSGRELKIKTEGNSPVYNHTLAKTLVEYASAIYSADVTELFTWTCARCCDMTTGFEMVELIVDVQNCLQAYVGFAHDLNAIVVVFRGTQENSVQNWIEDLLFKQLDLEYPGMPDAMVHRGFYSAYHNTTIRPGVVRAVQKSRKSYGENVPIMITGHSMGGAMAAFCALDLVVNHEIDNVQLMTFGQPRVGNTAFAEYFSKYVPYTFRVTHGHDIVPHLPPYYRYLKKTYHHFPREVWVHDIGLGSLVYSVEEICDGSGEDPTCSRSVTGKSVTDHVYYLGVNMHAESWSTCRIVMDYSTLQYEMDLSGNIVLSKHLNVPFPFAEERSAPQ